MGCDISIGQFRPIFTNSFLNDCFIVFLMDQKRKGLDNLHD